MPAAFRGLGPPVLVLEGGLASFLALPPLLGLGLTGGILDGGPAPAHFLERPEWQRHAFDAGSHRAQGTARSSVMTVQDGVRTTRSSATSR